MPIFQQIEAIFIDKPDPVINPVGTKGIGEISLIGVAAALANAVFTMPLVKG
jgi:xanthine dehydrogenase YagR molybdenum-binding subunit